MRPRGVPSNTAARWTEAEAAAYITCRKLGIDRDTSQAFSPAYIAGWIAQKGADFQTALGRAVKAQKTIFVCRYLRVRDLQREIEEGLNVMESSNRANSVIAYGGAGQIASNRRDEQEMFVACLRILQAALVYVNTLMLQDVLAEPAWGEALTPADQRGLTPLFWTHVLPYGEVKLDMSARLTLGSAIAPPE